MMRTNATKTWKQDLSDAAGPPVESSTVHWNCIRNRWKGVKKSGKQREKAEVCKITQEPDCRSDLTGLMEWWIQIWNQQRSSRERCSRECLQTSVKHDGGSMEVWSCQSVVIEFMNTDSNIMLYHVHHDSVPKRFIDSFFACILYVHLRLHMFW